MADWNSNQYLKFEKERAQPSADLISRLSDINPSRVLDIGCGPGNSTNLLAKRFKDAEILGVDSSDNMLEKAKATYPDFSFKKCILPNDFDKIDGKFDLIFSNACIHWIKEQELLIKSALINLKSAEYLRCRYHLSKMRRFTKCYINSLMKSGKSYRVFAIFIIFCLKNIMIYSAV